MKQINNNFIFFGAIHQDFVFELKNDLIKYRTNPIKHSESYGGVAHNVARVISKNENVSLFSIKSDKETIRYLKKIGINFISLNSLISLFNKACSTILLAFSVFTPNNLLFVFISSRVNFNLRFGLSFLVIKTSFPSFNNPIIEPVLGQ